VSYARLRSVRHPLTALNLRCLYLSTIGFFISVLQCAQSCTCSPSRALLSRFGASLACHSPVHLRLRRTRFGARRSLEKEKEKRSAERLGARVTLSLGDTRDSVTREIRCTSHLCGEERDAVSRNSI